MWWRSVPRRIAMHPNAGEDTYSLQSMYQTMAFRWWQGCFFNRLLVNSSIPMCHQPITQINSTFIYLFSFAMVEIRRSKQTKINKAFNFEWALNTISILIQSSCSVNICKNHWMFLIGISRAYIFHCVNSDVVVFFFFLFSASFFSIILHTCL